MSFSAKRIHGTGHVSIGRLSFVGDRKCRSRHTSLSRRVNYSAVRSQRFCSWHIVTQNITTRYASDFVGMIKCISRKFLGCRKDIVTRFCALKCTQLKAPFFTVPYKTKVCEIFREKWADNENLYFTNNGRDKKFDARFDYICNLKPKQESVTVDIAVFYRCGYRWQH